MARETASDVDDEAIISAVGIISVVSVVDDEAIISAGDAEMTVDGWISGG